MRWRAVSSTQHLDSRFSRSRFGVVLYSRVVPSLHPVVVTASQLAARRRNADRLEGVRFVLFPRSQHFHPHHPADVDAQLLLLAQAVTLPTSSSTFHSARLASTIAAAVRQLERNLYIARQLETATRIVAFRLDVVIRSSVDAAHILLERRSADPAQRWSIEGRQPGWEHSYQVTSRGASRGRGGNDDGRAGSEKSRK